ncbi:MAG: hypothetical protein E7396_00980 [Ruminococcaceae bacterium]|nr:hypothetical protein [Oscillospiraceae bacterium]
MKINKKSIIALIIVLLVAAFCFAGCAKDTAETNSQTETNQTEETKKTEESKTDDKKANDEKKEEASQAPVLGEDVKLNSGEVIKKDDIEKEAEEYIPDSLPEEIETVDDLMEYNDYIETLPEGREKELLLLKMQLFLEKIQ